MSRPPLYDPTCTLCPLHEGVHSVCVGARFSRTPQPGWHPKILFVGEAPGHSEDREGKPFMGAAGQLLNEAIKHYGIRDYAITNAVKCRPTDVKGKDRKPRAAEMKACAAYLKAEIERYKPQIIVPLGAVALKRLTGLDKVTEWAGRVYEPPGRDWKVYPIIHPAAVLRYEQRFQRPFEAQMRGLARLASGATPTPSNYVRLSLEEAVARLKKLAESEGPYGFDIETAPVGEKGNAHNPRFGRIISAAISTVKGEAFWWEWPEKTDDDLVLAMMALLKSGRPMVAHNAPFEVKWMLWHVVRHADGAAGDPGYWGDRDPETGRRQGGGWEGFTWSADDSLLLYYVLHEDAKGYYGLDHVRRALLPDMPEYDAKVMGLVNAGTAHHEIDMEDLGTYNAGDADATLRISTVLKRQVEGKRGLNRAYTQILQPLIFAIARCELAGRKIDFDQVKKLHDDFATTQRNAGLAMRTHKAVKAYCADKEKDIADWNPGSSAQVAPIVFDYLNLPVLGKTEGGKASVKGVFLEPLKAKSRFVRDYLEWKEARTLDNNYLLPYTAKTAPDGFLYGGYLAFGTATGRLSSVNPNLQNFAPILRTVVVSRFPNGKIVSSDYCLAPGTRVLTWDLRWKPIEQITMGEDLVGFPEDSVGRGSRSRDGRLRASKVLRTKRLSLPCYRVTTTHGTLVASERHGWVAKRGPTKAREWIQTQGLRPGMLLPRLAEPWVPERSYDAGWLAGFLDGEGYVSTTLGWGQNPGATSMRAKQLLKARGFVFGESTKQKCVKHHLRGGTAEVLRLLGTLRPRRLLGKMPTWLSNRRAWGRLTETARVLKVEYLGPRDVVALRTSTRTFIAEGFLSHNSQLELRLMAMEAGCEVLLEAFRQKKDTHALTATHVASELYGRAIDLAEIMAQHKKAEEDHTESWRQEYGKRPNFALLYGAFPKTFSEQFHVPIETAEVISRAWHGIYPEVREYLDSVHRKVKEKGWIESRFGRRRRLPLAVGDPPFKTEGWWAQKAAFREAGNFPIQSLGSDLNTMAFCRVLAEIDQRGMPVVPLGMTHDSQDYDVEEDAINDFAALLRRIMVEETHALFPWLTVPLDIDVKVGPSWGSLTKWKP